MKKITLLKLGGSLITDKKKAFTPKLEIIHNLSKQIKQAFDINPNLKLIIGNGSGSFAHYPAVQYKMKRGIREEKQKFGFCLVQNAAAKLNRIIVEELLKTGIKAISLNPSSMIVSNNNKIKRFFLEPFFGLLSLEITPVIYGDIVYDESLGAKIYSTEQLLGEIALNFKKKGYQARIIHNGITKGVLDQNGEPIPIITEKDINNVKKSLYSTSGYDITGGMVHKINESLNLAKQGIKSLIINGTSEENLLTRALLEEQVIGTVIQ